MAPTGAAVARDDRRRAARPLGRADVIGSPTLHTGRAPLAEATPDMEASRTPAVLYAGPLEIRPAEHMALACGHPLILSVQEFRLLCVLAARLNRIVTRDELYRSVWGGPLRPGDRSVDVYIRKLRVKLAEALPDFCCIHTHVGFGYRFRPERSHHFHTAATAS
jgi:DNA-binding response OmpR family regulator